jgi:hypothetical protein
MKAKQRKMINKSFHQIKMKRKLMDVPVEISEVSQN